MYMYIIIVVAKSVHDHLGFAISLTFQDTDTVVLKSLLQACVV